MGIRADDVGANFYAQFLASIVLTFCQFEIVFCVTIVANHEVRCNRSTKLAYLFALGDTLVTRLAFIHRPVKRKGTTQCYDGFETRIRKNIMRFPIQNDEVVFPIRWQFWFRQSNHLRFSRRLVQ